MKFRVKTADGFTQDFPDIVQYFVGAGGELVIHADPKDGAMYDETTWRRGLIHLFAPNAWASVVTIPDPLKAVA